MSIPSIANKALAAVFANYRTLWKRTLPDFGTVRNVNATKAFYGMADQNLSQNNIVFSWFGEAATKTRTASNVSYASKGYSTNTNQRLISSELLVNGDAESVTALNSVGNHTNTRITTDFHSGTACFDVVSTGVGDGNNGVYTSAIVNTGDNYTRTFWAKSISGNTSLVARSNSSYFGTTTPYTLTTNWQQFTLTATATGSAPSMYFYLLGAGEFLLDDISFKQNFSIVIDAVQTTDLNQPVIAGNIAPNEKICLKNNNGDSRYLTHPTISFAATDAWSVTTVINANGSDSTFVPITDSGSDKGTLRFASGSNNFSFNLLSDGVDYNFGNNSCIRYYGKNTIVSFICDGTSIRLYLNGVYFSFVTPPSTAILFTGILKGWGSSRQSFSTISAHIIRSGALTQQQITSEYNFLRSLYSEIPSVTITDANGLNPQIWQTSNCEMVTTPQGNLINNVTDNTFVEKIPQALNLLSGWSYRYGTIVNSNTYTSILNNPNDAVFFSTGLSLSKYHKITVSGTTTCTGNIQLSDGVNTIYNLPISNGSFSLTSYYWKSFDRTPFYIYFQSAGTTVFTNISVQQVGWANSTELYDNVYAQTAEVDSAVEKITNAADREFSSDTGFWSKNTSVTISGGTVNVGTYPEGISTPNLLVSGRIYKCTVTAANWTSGTWGISSITTSSATALLSGNGTYSFYFIANGTTPTTFRLYGRDGMTFDNISVKELGLSDATSITNYTYAGVKAAAMWSYYNNDVAIGSVYGKLYNWYAAKLLQMDIDYFNTANPTATWGYRIPTDTDFNLLATNLGGTAIAGGKLKKDGLVYWNTPNTGANNSSGFSALGSGRRSEDGSFSLLNLFGQFTSLTENGVLNNTFAELLNTTNTFSPSNFSSKIRGRSLRLIKT